MGGWTCDSENGCWVFNRYFGYNCHECDMNPPLVDVHIARPCEVCIGTKAVEKTADTKTPKTICLTCGEGIESRWQVVPHSRSGKGKVVKLLDNGKYQVQLGDGKTVDVLPYEIRK